MDQFSYSQQLIEVLSQLDALTNWEERPRGGMRVNLDPIADLMHRLGEPHRRFQSIHVAGTKGKSSTCALLEAALMKGNIRVGRYTSPHVDHICERISISGHPVAELDLANAITATLAALRAARTAGTSAKDATWFDILTASAFLLFQKYNVEWAIVETGLGGRLDSTNILASDVQVITNVELEHTEVLGSTRSQIAFEKAGIIKQGSHVITPLSGTDEAGQVIEARANELGAILARSAPGVTILERNKNVARQVLKAVNLLNGNIGDWLLDDDTAASTKLPGRLEFCTAEVNGTMVPVVFDGAHVPFNLAAVLTDIEGKISAQPCVAVVAIAIDKDADGLLRVLRDWNVQAIFTEANSRSRSSRDLHDLAKGIGLRSSTAENPGSAYLAALHQASEQRGWVLVTGSLYLVSLVHQFA
ncbi:bifunctional folylpolyglutamate synthase/dihydrofolate synthase [Rhizobium leguminosarum bv. viciae]|nr:bifunctional folylpolyglutamate synthase/dihydrofolate synthase [Rhizobium leguminosarum bv. viciae]